MTSGASSAGTPHGQAGGTAQAAEPSPLLHKAYDALLDIQNMAGVVIAPSLMRELYEAIAGQSAKEKQG